MPDLTLTGAPTQPVTLSAHLYLCSHPAGLSFRVTFYGVSSQPTSPTTPNSSLGTLDRAATVTASEFAIECTLVGVLCI